MRNLLRRVFFLLYAYYMVVCFLFCNRSWCRVLCRLLSCPLPSVCFPSDRIPALFCFGSVYLETTVGLFVVDESISDEPQQEQRVCDFVLFCLLMFVFVFFRHIGESSMGPARVLFLDS